MSSRSYIGAGIPSINSIMLCFIILNHLTFQLSALKRAHWSTKSSWQVFFGYVTPFRSHKKAIWKGNNPWKHDFSGGTAVSFGRSMFHQPEIMLWLFRGGPLLCCFLPLSVYVHFMEAFKTRLSALIIFSKIPKALGNLSKRTRPQPYTTQCFLVLLLKQATL